MILHLGQYYESMTAPGSEVSFVMRFERFPLLAHGDLCSTYPIFLSSIMCVCFVSLIFLYVCMASDTIMWSNGNVSCEVVNCLR